MTDLELVSTTDLLREITNRFDTMIFMGMAHQEGTMSDLYCSGNRFTCLGLLGAASRIILQEIKAGHINANNPKDPLNGRENDGTW